jgi:hypothetical protein
LARAAAPLANSRGRAQARLERREELEALARLLGDVGGRRWVRRFLQQFHVLADDTAVATNAMALSFREGERNAGLQLQAALAAANHDAFLLLLKELNDERRSSVDGGSDRGTGAEFDDDRRDGEF